VLGSCFRAGIVFLSADSIALSSECQPVRTAPSCAAYQGRLAANSCLNTGVIFVEQDGGWTPVVHNRVPYPSKKTLNFFYVVDASRTRQPNGLVFVGIARTLGISSPSAVRLKQNDQFGFDQKESLQVYTAAVKWEGHRK